MAVKNLPKQFPTPDQEQANTYPGYLNTYGPNGCQMPLGMFLKPSSLPSATINVGDIIADQTKILTLFASMYNMMAIMMKMINCIMDVLCALTNPFLLIPAMVRLFQCFADFILILPQLAVPAKIICFIKIVVSVIDYILNVLLPIVEDIVANVETLLFAFRSGNQDAIEAVSFKIAGLLQEIFNIVGILSPILPLVDIIKSLQSQVKNVGLPCIGAGGSCSSNDLGPACGEDQCPDMFKDFSFSGTGAIVQYGSGSDIQYLLRAPIVTATISAEEAINDGYFQTIEEFYPSDLDEGQLSPSIAPYLVEMKKFQEESFGQIEGTPFLFYATGSRKIGSYNYLELDAAPSQTVNSGYLIDTYYDEFKAKYVKLPSNQIRLSYLTTEVMAPVANDTSFLTPIFVDGINWVGQQITILSDNRTEATQDNVGTYTIVSVYSEFEVGLTRSGDWAGNNQWSNPSVPQSSHITWQYELDPSELLDGDDSVTVDYTVDINHETLIKHEVIGAGCHPSVIDSKNNALVGLNLADLPEIPDVDLDLSDCVAPLAPSFDNQNVPIGITSDWVKDNYDQIALDVIGVARCIENKLLFANVQLLDYGNSIVPNIVSPIKTDFYVNRNIQQINGDIIVTVEPLDFNGSNIAENSLPGLVEVEIFNTKGELSLVTEILDDYGLSTGAFQATLTSDEVIISSITASVNGIVVSDQVGNDLVNREIEVKFVLPSEATGGTDPVEPLGLGGE